MPYVEASLPPRPRGAIRIATWNINSVRLRIGLLQRLATETDADVICLQETKATNDVFPAEAIAAMGYPHQHFQGDKGYNGVAILSRLALDARGRRLWAGKEDSRHVEATLPSGIELHCVYVPAGGDVPDPARNEKFAHKLAFLDEMRGWLTGVETDRKAILVGDLNIAPLETDVWSHKQLLRVVSHTPVETARFEEVRAAGQWVDAVRHFVPPEHKLFTWWSYRAADWAAADKGRRLDHIWVTPHLAGRLHSAEVIREARGWRRPSDHVPVIARIAPAGGAATGTAGVRAPVMKPGLHLSGGIQTGGSAGGMADA